MSIDQFSVASVPLIMNIGESLKAHGSAFFYRKNGNIYLVTNWHNLSGRSADTGQPHSNTGGIPDSISLHFHIENQLGKWSQLNTFSLNSEDGSTLWLQHAQYGQNVDIAILKISVPPGLCVYPINEMPSTDIHIDIGMDVFVLGFPIRLFTGIFPIWKRGTIATEYEIMVDGIPKLLIDTATQKGMSGSPVILQERIYTDANDGQTKMTMPPAKKFLGVYSGRYSTDNLAEAQLGIVWRKELIDQIIDSGVPGQYEIR